MLITNEHLESGALPTRVFGHTKQSGSLPIFLTLTLPSVRPSRNECIQHRRTEATGTKHVANGSSVHSIRYTVKAAGTLS